MTSEAEENRNHFVPQFLLRAWAYDSKKTFAWVFDPSSWTIASQRISDRLQTSGAASLNAFWNDVVEQPAAHVVNHLRQRPRGSLDSVEDLKGLAASSRGALGLFMLTQQRRNPDMPPAWRDMSEEQWAAKLRPKSERDRLRSLAADPHQYRYFLFLLSSRDGCELALGDWQVFFLCIDNKDVAVMPLGPGHALLMTHPELDANALRTFFIGSPIPPGEMTLGTFAASDMLLPPSARMEDEKNRTSFILKWRGNLWRVKAAVDDHRLAIIRLKGLGLL